MWHSQELHLSLAAKSTIYRYARSRSVESNIIIIYACFKRDDVTSESRVLTERFRS